MGRFARLHIPVGLPGCGKSTWSKQFKLVAPSVTSIVSTDEIRQKLKKSNDLDLEGYYPALNDETFTIFHKSIENQLRYYGSNVIADATNLEASARQELYKIADKARTRFGEMGITVNLVVFTNVEEAFRRNAERSGWARVPNDVMINNMLPRFEQTMREIEQEPFDTITYIERIGVKDKSDGT